MQMIQLVTRIEAPRERCFLLSLSVDLHMNSTAPTRERAITGVTHGVMGAGDVVTWQGMHFGLRLRHTSRISDYEPYTYFCDEMVRGAFRSFRHQHYFDEERKGFTVMRDVLEFSAPLGVLGLIAERLVLRSYMTGFLAERNTVIKRVAESEEWKGYLS
jgi:ligand-binding SRPBCC domain-containing protein